MPRPHLRRPSAALAISTVAVVVALGGTSYAAFSLPQNSVGTKQLKNKAVTLQKIAPATQRALAKLGPRGPQGAQGQQGIQGVPGPPGPVSTTAPSGITQRGQFYIDGYAAVDDAVGGAISFPLELASAPKPVEVPPGGPSPDPAHCSGTAAAPSAAPGYLCVYDSYAWNASGENTYLSFRDLKAQDGADPFGAGIFTQAVATGDAYVAGSWAVTAP